MERFYKFLSIPIILVVITFFAIFFIPNNAEAIAADSSCSFSPKGGIFPQGKAFNIEIKCGVKVTKASYRWDKGSATGFATAPNNHTVTVSFSGEKNQVLYVDYTYYYFLIGTKKFKKISASAIFKVSKDICVISPNGATASSSIPVSIKCGSNIKNASLKWGNKESENINLTDNLSDSTDFLAEKNDILKLTYFYDTDPSPKITKLKQANIIANYSVQRCIDTLSGVIYTTGASVTNIGNSCSGDKLIKNYCSGNEKKISSQPCAHGCKDNSCAANSYIADDPNHLFDTEAKCILNNDYANYKLKSNYLANDKDALAIATGTKTVRMPSTIEFKERDITWRITNALQMIGYTVNGILYSRKIDSNTIKEIDCRLAKAEAVIKTQAAKLPNFLDISGPKFRDNLPREYAAYTYSKIFDLFNIQPNKQFFSYTNNCLFAALCPQMPEALANGGDKQCYDKSLVASTSKYIVQSPGLFGFYKDRFNNFMFSGALDGGQYPPNSTPFIATYQSILVHEIAHELEELNVLSNDKYQKYKRSECSNASASYMLFDSPFSPFVDDGIKGNQNLDDFVSIYASGMSDFSSLNKNYLPGQYNRSEDIAETVTAYILYPEYFRWKYNKSATPNLYNKYYYIKGIFGGLEFSNSSLAGINSYKMPGHINGLINANSIIEKFNLNDIKVKNW